MYTDRIHHLTTQLKTRGLDAIALNPGPTMTYLTGMHFHLMERPTVLLLAPDQTPVLILPELEMRKAEAAEMKLSCFAFGDTPTTWGSIFQRACQSLQLSGRKIGVEPNRLRFLELRLLEAAAPGAQFSSAEEILNRLRMRKDAEEIAAMRRAVQIAQDGLEAALQNFQVGMTERQFAAELCIQLLRAGSDSELPFAPIIAGGPNSANPHAVPTERPIQSGDLLVVDWGAAYNGYYSDLTRTFAIGKVDPEFEHIAQIVLQANTAGRAAGRPGVSAGSVDQVTRAVIQRADYGPFFTHRTGHGLGMEGHEPPYMFGENQLVLEPGMTYTIEPGIYLTGRGGVRIEDDMVVTAEGSESLSDMPRQLRVIGI